MSESRDVHELLPLPHLEFQVLACLAGGDLHGYGIVKEVAARSEAGTTPSTGSLYLAIARLQDNGLVEETETPPGEDDRRRTYRMTRFGRRVAEAEARRLGELARITVDRLGRRQTAADGG